MTTHAIYQDQITLAVTGASGSGYFLKLLESLVKADIQVYLLLSDAAKIVLKTEENELWPDNIEKLNTFLEKRFNAKTGQIISLAAKDWFSPVASGSSAPRKMVICPCSCGTLASIAQGLSNNLIENIVSININKKPRSNTKPSDHTPIELIIN